jgi:hypothetical protein
VIGFVKLNVDVAFNEDEGKGAFGAILRDVDGSFVAASCDAAPYAESVVMTEALPTNHGFQLAVQGCNRFRRNLITLRKLNGCMLGTGSTVRCSGGSVC